MSEKKEVKEEKDREIQKLILFNNSDTPFELRKGPNGERRRFAPHSSIECMDEAEYNQLRKYKGMGNTAKVSPDLGRYVVQLEAEKKALQEEIAELKKKKG